MSVPKADRPLLYLYLCHPYATVTADGDDDVWLSVTCETHLNGCLVVSLHQLLNCCKHQTRTPSLRTTLMSQMLMHRRYGRQSFCRCSLPAHAAVRHIILALDSVLVVTIYAVWSLIVCAGKWSK
jgi:hypothetical protein